MLPARLGGVASRRCGCGQAVSVRCPFRRERWRAAASNDLRAPGAVPTLGLRFATPTLDRACRTVDIIYSESPPEAGKKEENPFW